MSQATLAERVSALRRRLEEIAPREVAPLSDLSPRLRQLQELCRRNQTLQEQTQLVAAQTQELDKSPPALSTHAGQELPGPKQISWQTRRCLVECRQCLQTLKAIGDSLNGDFANQLRWLACYQLTVSMAECLVRGLQSLPEGALEQNRVAYGLGGWVAWLKMQVAAIETRLEWSRHIDQHIRTLAHAIQSLCQRRPVLQRTLIAIAEELLDSDPAHQPLELLSPRPPAEYWAATHGWNTAQVIARVIRRHRELRQQAVPVLVAALLHDSGMATVSPVILEQEAPLTDAQRREIEAHVGISAEALRLCCPQEFWLIEGVLAHHERLDGSGYPAGQQGQAINSLARLLAVADTYVALATPRPYRPALSPRQALIEVLAEAEKGRLDISAAELLLHLSLYPVGSIIELSDGSIGQVVALNEGNSDSLPPKPIVAVLLEKTGQPLATPRYINLAGPTAPTILRQVPLQELYDINPLGWWVQLIPLDALPG